MCILYTIYIIYLYTIHYFFIFTCIRIIYIWIHKSSLFAKTFHVLLVKPSYHPYLKTRVSYNCQKLQLVLTVPSRACSMPKRLVLQRLVLWTMLSTWCQRTEGGAWCHFVLNESVPWWNADFITNTLRKKNSSEKQHLMMTKLKNGMAFQQSCRKIRVEEVGRRRKYMSQRGSSMGFCDVLPFLFISRVFHSNQLTRSHQFGARKTNGPST